MVTFLQAVAINLRAQLISYKSIVNGLLVASNKIVSVIFCFFFGGYEPLRFSYTLVTSQMYVSVAGALSAENGLRNSQSSSKYLNFIRVARVANDTGTVGVPPSHSQQQITHQLFWAEIQKPFKLCTIYVIKSLNLSMCTGEFIPKYTALAPSPYRPEYTVKTVSFSQKHYSQHPGSEARPKYDTLHSHLGIHSAGFFTLLS